MTDDAHPSPTSALSRRRLLRGAAALGTATAAGGALSLAGAPAAHAAVPGFPTFSYYGQVFDKSRLRYNPTNELIFPSVRHVAGRIANPLGRWYMYYAPHDNPGGICLAYADTITGPWREYPNNPVIPRTWASFDVSHVSSPDAFYNPADRKIYLFFHGENHTTRVASSSDGRTFQYHNRVVGTYMLPGVSETSYARVFPHPTKAGMYIMLFMGNHGGTRKIYIGWSHALTSGWQVKPDPLISPRAGEGGQLSGAHYWSRNGGGHVVYHSGAGNIHVARVGTGFDREDHLGVLYDSRSGAPDNGRAAAPSFVEVDGRLHMFYEAGQRGSTNIALARAN
ncbi:MULTISPECIES: hypothetical protein [Streptomyces]|uniref:hypothetical protein n=1 Tax=Streptomyces TaxID=1883 RepID=UPI00159145D7|nr:MULTISPECIES: hypothetical protein [Streptomyces]QKV71260.1 hypothetical protein HUT13_22720 [Streptomyces harbinensis]